MTALLLVAADIDVGHVILALIAGVALGVAGSLAFSVRRAMHLMTWMRELIDELTVERERATAEREEWEQEHHA